MNIIEKLCSFFKKTKSQKFKKCKNYVVLEKTKQTEVRLYNPTGRSVFLRDKGYKYIDFPYIIFACVRGRVENHLFAGIVLNDISKYSEFEQKEEVVYRMPFPGHFYRGQFGPCCMPSEVRGRRVNLDKLVDVFWKSDFFNISYGKNDIEEFKKQLKNLPSFYSNDYQYFLNEISFYGI